MLRGYDNNEAKAMTCCSLFCYSESDHCCHIVIDTQNIATHGRQCDQYVPTVCGTFGHDDEVMTGDAHSLVWGTPG